MRLLPLTLLALCAPAAAQTLLPIPAYVRTFTASATRGLWFQSPAPIVITGLNVPDETSQGIQNVEVLSLGAAPPAYPATMSGTQLFYAANAPAGTTITTNIAVASGDFIGVLGACGTTSLANSYGAGGTYASSILGMPVILDRFLTQANINTAGGNQLVSAEPNGSVGRVEVYYVPASGLFPGFTQNVTSGPAPLTVNFTDQSFTSDPNGILTWLWDFDNDGTPDSTLQNPSHTYPTCGTYDVTLQVLDATHGFRSVTKTGLINVDPVYCPFGSGCPNSGGNVTTLTAAAAPRINQTFSVTLNNLPVDLAFMVFGVDISTFNGAPLPIDMAQFGMPGCDGLVAPAATTLVIGTGGTGTWNLPIPNNPAFVGTAFYNQALVVDPGVNQLGAVMSDGVGGVVGL